MLPPIVENLYPGATTCIVIGDLAGLDPARLHSFRYLLWWREDESAMAPPLESPVEILDSATPDVAVERFLRRDPRHLPSLYVTEGAAGERAGPVIEAVHRVLESAHRTRLTRQKDGFTWQKHILRNAPAYLRQRLPESWAGALRGLPAFVCGAGPSLDVSVSKLAGAADRAVIFASDSALRALARHGVAADFAVSIDAAKVPEKCLPAKHSPARLVVASISPPGWQTALPSAPPVFISGRQITDDWFAALGASRTTLAAAESCGSTALELAHHLGCDPIYLFGLDLAVDSTDQARRHQRDADPALYVQSLYDPAVSLPRVPGNYAPAVPCFALGDWRELDTRLAGRVGSKIFNVTDRGARLRGTTLIHPDDFSVQAPVQPKTAPLSLLDRPSAELPGVATRIRTAGEQCRTALPSLRDALARGGPPALASAFVPLMVGPDTGRLLGAFGLKLMPHLVPPIEGDATFWKTLLAEYGELCALLTD